MISEHELQNAKGAIITDDLPKFELKCSLKGGEFLHKRGQVLKSVST